MMLERLNGAIDAAVPCNVTHIGFIAVNANGEVLLTQPNSSKYGVTVTFSRIKREQHGSPSKVLARCITEQLGQPPLSAFPVPITWATPNSTSFYFAGFVPYHTDNYWVMPNVGIKRWSSVADAVLSLNTSSNLNTRQRDLALLDEVIKLSLSPARRILEMVSHLHKLGFERIRVVPYMSPSGGHWRCLILPASCISNRRGAEPNHVAMDRFMNYSRREEAHTSYTTGMEQYPFDWQDAAFDTPQQLAEKYLIRMSEFALAGYGADASYAEWYDQMLNATRPYGVAYAFADMGYNPDYLTTIMAPSCDRFRLPPPGEANAVE